jgi:hypothetical protein
MTDPPIAHPAFSQRKKNDPANYHSIVTELSFSRYTASSWRGCSWQRVVLRSGKFSAADRGSTVKIGLGGGWAGCRRLFHIFRRG